MTNIQEKKFFYEEALDSLMEFEFQYLILSIYFEREVDFLFAELRNTINRNIPMGYQDEYGLLRFTRVKQVQPPSVREFLAETMNELIGIKELPFSNEENSSPEVYQLSVWLSRSLLKAENFQKIARALMHYSRYWSEAYGDSSRYVTKGIILLDKINQVYANIDISLLKINLLDIIKKLRYEVSNLMPMSCTCPFTDGDSSVQMREGKKGYLNRLNEFNLLLERNSIFFENLFETELSAIFEMHARLSPKLRPYFEEIVYKAFIDGRGLLPGDYAYIKSIRNSEDYSKLREVRDFCSKVISFNYLYELR